MIINIQTHSHSMKSPLLLVKSHSISIKSPLSLVKYGFSSHSYSIIPPFSSPWSLVRFPFFLGENPHGTWELLVPSIRCRAAWISAGGPRGLRPRKDKWMGPGARCDRWIGQTTNSYYDMYMYICIYVYVYIYMFMYMYIYIYVYVYMYMYICIYVYMYMYIHMYK